MAKTDPAVPPADNDEQDPRQAEPYRGPSADEFPLDPSFVLDEVVKSKGERGATGVSDPSETLAPEDSAVGIDSVYFGSGLALCEDVESLTGEDLPRRHSGTFCGFMRWYGALLLTGVGMFIEAFIIVTTGQVKTVWKDGYPACWYPGEAVNCPQQVQCPGLFPSCTAAPCPAQNNAFCTGPGGTYPSNELCSAGVLNSISYSEFAGIMAGMLTFGYVADLFGRRWASLCTGTCMLAGVAVMTFVYSRDTETMFLVFSIFFGVFGLGVGGEYPIAASSAAERKERQVELDTHGEGSSALYFSHAVLRSHRIAAERAKSKRRGEAISIVFSMQGIGAVVGSIVLLVAVAIAQQGPPNCSLPQNNEMGYSQVALMWTWRSFYLIGVVLLVLVLLFRLHFLSESDTFLKARERRERRSQRFTKEGRVIRNKYAVILRHYWPRLIATGGAWLLFDFQFYGNKLFSGPIFSAILPQPNLLATNAYLLLNNAIALIGYYCSALVIDRQWCGRRRLQTMGFCACFVLFLISGAMFDRLQRDNPDALLALYILSTFFGQFGPNVTTYVCAAELYPSETRATTHGLSAFSGKVGALLATIIFGYVSTQVIFYVSAAVSILGAVFTVLFLPDVTGMSLQEHDIEYELVLEERATEYGGEAVNPKHLSWFERWRGRGAQYQPSWIAGFRERELRRKGVDKVRQA